MNEKYTFTATIENAGGGGAFVRIPLDVEQVFGRKRVPVKASIDGQPCRGTLVRMGEPCHILGMTKEIRRRIGKTFGDQVEITLEEDHEERVVELPDDLHVALDADPAAKAAFEKLSYTHRKEYVRFILDAKREETRLSRILKTIEMLKHPRTVAG